jgi:AcrR family transcriptional regulator
MFNRFTMAGDKELFGAAERRIHDAALRIFARTGRTNLTISELANEAGVARGTVYHHVQLMEALFENVTARLTAEMYRRVHKSIATTDIASNPVARLAMGIRLCIRRAHEDPLWGKFIYSFGFRAKVLHKLWSSAPTDDLLAGVQTGQFLTRPEQLRLTISFIAGVVSGAINLVATGHETWRSAGTQAVEFILQALGVPALMASHLANQELPPLLPDD